MILGGSTPGRTLRLWRTCATWAPWVLLTGCAGRDASVAGNANASSRAVERVARTGPVEIRLRVDDSSPTFGTSMRARVEVLADEGVVARLDDYALAMDRQPFGYGHALRRSEDSVLQPDGRRHWIREFELTFLVPGEQVLPPAKVTFIAPPETDPPPADQAAAEHEVMTESITLSVAATAALDVSPERIGELEVPHPIELPEDSRARRWWRWGMAAALVAALAGMAWWWRRRGLRPALVEPPLSPEDWATRELDALLAAGLIEDGLVAEFYFRISAIVRGFIERRFGLRAEEMTTEEFLESALVEDVLGRSNRGLLGEFLEACDLVKFARHEPRRDAIEQTVRAARTFIAAMGRTTASDGLGAGEPGLPLQEAGA